ncbi:PrsW family intramembrane metalloprotease [Fodinicola acaciae]|uniref:PrsW family intramembrane metalloprotease n=1 Tax=Fodinicola acaciae TaxID=2681555 RepID=UPI0013CF5658|nr:PrsW family intramembrane metalloprotease [Fodinicola acaciae]
MSYPYGAAPGGYAVGPIPTAPAQAYPMPAPYRPVYQPMRQTGIGKIIFWIIAGLVFLVCGLASVVLTGFETGIVGVALGAIFAILPVPVIALTAVWLSWAQPQPWGARIFALCWGAAIATLFAAIFNTVTGLVITQQVGQSSGDILTAVLVAPPVEETCKGLALLGIFLFSRFGNNGRYFTGPVDGITYALFAGAGFAFTENIAYLGRAYAGGLQASNGMTGTALVLLLFVFAIRCVGTPFGHPLFTSATGLGLGVAARSNHHIAVRIIAPVVGWLVAMMLHGLFNLTASYLPDYVMKALGGDSLTSVLIANGSFVVALFPLFAIGVAVAIYARQSQFRVVKRGLPQYASAGWIGQDEVDWLSTLRGRSQARKWARQVAGQPGLSAMKEYQYAATRLAILRDGANRGQVPHDFARTEQGLLAALGQQRKFFSPHAAQSGQMPGGAAPRFTAQAYGSPQSAPPYGQASSPPYGQPSAPPYGSPQSAPPYGPGGQTQSWNRPPS